jgi:Thermolysin metallopeptidase, alpha-helical domain
MTPGEHPVPSAIGALTLTALAAAFALAVAVAPDAAEADTESFARAGDAGRASGWTRTLVMDLSARELGLPARAPATRLARAALARNAERLGLRRSLRGLRLDRELRIPARAGGRPLRQLRFQQTVRGVRVVWSQINVTVAAGAVTAVDATVVPIAGRAVGAFRISRERALTIARRAVRGAERALPPRRVAYAGAPTTRARRLRTPRLAWVVEVAPAATRDEEVPVDLCIVVDAQSGRVIARWPGMADRPDRAGVGRGARAAGSRTAQAGGALMLTVFDAQALGQQPVYANFRTTGNPRVGRSWPPLDRAQFLRPRTAAMDTLAVNAVNVAFTICARRGYCGKRGGFRGIYQRWEVFGNDSDRSGSSRFDGTVHINASDVVGFSDFNDVIAHEFGHVMDWTYAGDRFLDGTQTVQGREVEEALADMFAYDYDRDDATLGEATRFGNGLRVNWAQPGAVRHLMTGPPYPAHMDDYDPTPPHDSNGRDDYHFNSTILSHAYYRFVQRVGPDVAGNVLQYIPYQLDPRPTFVQVRNAFVRMASQLYPHDSPADADTVPEVTEGAILVHNAVGICFGGCR